MNIGLRLKLLTTPILIGGVYSCAATASDNDIAYLRHTGNYWQVWLTQAAPGAKHSQLTTTQYDKTGVTWSDDGRDIYISGSDGYVRRVGLDSKKEEIISGPELAFDAKHHPKEKKIVYTRATTSEFDNNSLWIHDLSSGADYQLKTSVGLHQTPAWSTGGSLLFALRVNKGFSHIWVFDQKASKLNQISVEASDHYDPSSSAMGRLAYTKSIDGNYDIWYRENTDGASVRLTNNIAFDGQPSWAPDDKSLVFYSTRNGNQGIWQINIEANSKARRISPDNVQARYPVWKR